jgi:hypothetical protein
MALVSRPSEMRLFLIKVDPLFLIDFMQGIGSKPGNAGTAAHSRRDFVPQDTTAPSDRRFRLRETSRARETVG